jgi:hypothetical protein
MYRNVPRARDLYGVCRLHVHNVTDSRNVGLFGGTGYCRQGMWLTLELCKNQSFNEARKSGGLVPGIVHLGAQN